MLKYRRIRCCSRSSRSRRSSRRRSSISRRSSGNCSRSSSRIVCSRRGRSSRCSRSSRSRSSSRNRSRRSRRNASINHRWRVDQQSTLTRGPTLVDAWLLPFWRVDYTTLTRGSILIKA